MRSIAPANVSFVSSAEALDTKALRTVFIESADPVDLHRRVREAFLALIAEPNRVWLVTFVDLAGGGHGHTFTFWAELVDVGIFTAAQGFALTEATNDTNTAFWLAAQSEALVLANQRVLTPFTNVEVQQTLLGGASQGTRFMGAYLGEMETGT